MKKALTYWFVFLFLLAATSFLFVGCSAKKTISENKEEIDKKTSNTFVATNDKTIISQAVEDSMRVDHIFRRGREPRQDTSLSLHGTLSRTTRRRTRDTSRLEAYDGNACYRVCSGSLELRKHGDCRRCL